MFFVLSKIFWSLAHPLSLTAILIAAGVVLALLNRKRLSIAAATLAFLVIFVSSWTTFGALILHPLENRFERPERLDGPVAGVIVLGGMFKGGINLVRKGHELNNSADRIVEAAILARQNPQARILVTGGSGALFLDGEGDADAAPRLLMALGVDEERLLLEGDSRNTHENAVFSRRLADPQPGETWLLVTSAFHMPRSVGLFRKAGFDVVPWPTDYRTAGNEPVGLARDNAVDSLQNAAMGIREWIGLVAYRLTGRIDELVPGPR